MSKKVYVLWFGQTLSWTGSAMSFFAIGVWIFETTGRASALSTILHHYVMQQLGDIQMLSLFF